MADADDGKLGFVEKRLIRVLLVEDNPGDAHLVCEFLAKASSCVFEMSHVETLKQAIQSITSQKFDALLLDLSLPDAFGVEGLLEIRSAAPDLPVVVLSGNSEGKVVREAMGKGAQDYLLKGELSERELCRSLVFAVDRQQYHQGLKEFAEKERLARVLAENAREELRLAKIEADFANSSKSMFLANMSHEMRTPLGIILGFSEIALLDSQSEMEHQNALERIHRNAVQLAALVDDILDLSKVEADKFDPEFLEFSISAFLSDFVEGFTNKAIAKGLGLHVLTDKSVSQKFTTDPTRLKQILNNVVGNAIKFTPSGNVTMTLKERRSENSDPAFLVIEIKDTGIGLTPEQCLKLFQPFSQADSSMTRKFGGTGLGLILSRKLARSIGGELTLISSQENVGTCFELVVPLSSISRASLLSSKEIGRIDESVSSPLLGHRVLVVEDSFDNQALIGLYLKRAGAEVCFCDNGADGVKTALECEFDIVLMDIQMPVMEGCAATSILRAKGYSKPIIALTAHAMQGEREKSMRAGFSEYLTKPVDKTALLKTIKDFCPTGAIRPI